MLLKIIKNNINTNESMNSYGWTQDDINNYSLLTELNTENNMSKLKLMKYITPIK